MASYYSDGSVVGGDMTYTKAVDNLEQEQQDLDTIDKAKQQPLTKEVVKSHKV
jgi:hypothetical protein